MNIWKKQVAFLFCMYGFIGFSQTPELNDSLNSEQVKRMEPLIRLTQDSLIQHPQAMIFDSLWQQKWHSDFKYDYLHENDTVTKLSDELITPLTSDSLRLRLEALNAISPIHFEYNEILEYTINSYLKRNRVYLEKVMSLSDYYFPIFEAVLDRYDVPQEMKYLAIVESALNPTAKSRVGASGLWQFMYQTGRLYELEVSSYVDERFDPLKSTEAACKYMLDLYSVYQDWNLVLAAYNAGPGNVNKAIRRSGGYTNYWNIRPYLPRETAEYVPRFLAIMYLYNYAENHGFKPNRNQYLHFETDTVQVKQLIKFEHLQKKIGIDIDVIKFLNPEYKLEIVPAPKNKTYSIRLPIEYAGLLVSNEAEIYAWAKEEIEQAEKPLPENVKWNERIVYRVKKGDFLGKIANLHKVSVGQIKRWNNLRSDRLSIGQRLVIYPKR